MTNFSGFKWLDLLEKEFDKSFVGLDQSIRSVSEEYELEEIYDTERRLLANLAHCFVQLVHKSQTIFQVNAKLEAEVLNLKEELNHSQKSLLKTESEKSYLLCLLQSCLLENSILKSKSQDISDLEQEKLAERVQLRLANDLAAIQKADWEEICRREKLNSLDMENQQLRKQISELESEIVGARLDAKYLDKELAGRIQQIQILLASNATQEHKQTVWAQIEAEMHLQRSKTIANMCYSKQKLRDQQKPKQSETQSEQPQNEANGHVTKPMTDLKPCKSRIKQVHLHKHDADELGMAILGGVEHGLPIIISEVFPNSAVGRNQKIYAGDVILGVNGDSFTEMGHHEAVKYLSALRGTIRFDLENNIEADIDEVCDMDTRLYQFHLSETSETTRNEQKAPKLSYPGVAKDVRSTSTTGSTLQSKDSIEARNANQPPKKTPLDLPKVHAASPNKTSKTQSPKTSEL